jgi:hypothetical protein
MIGRRIAVHSEPAAGPAGCLDLSAGFSTDAEFAEMASRYATPGGTDEQVRDTLATAGAHQIVRQALSDVLARISSGRPQRPAK